MTTYLIHFAISFLIPYVSGASLGFLLGWRTFERKFYRPLQKRMREALDGWQDTIDNSMKMVKERTVKVKVAKEASREDGLILSPLQVQFPGQRRKRDDDEG